MGSNPTYVNSGSRKTYISEKTVYEFWITASYPNGSAGSSQGFTLTHFPSDAVTYVSSEGAKSDTHTDTFTCTAQLSNSQR